MSNHPAKGFAPLCIHFVVVRKIYYKCGEVSKVSSLCLPIFWKGVESSVQQRSHLVEIIVQWCKHS